jgi:hypothetical protein
VGLRDRGCNKGYGLDTENFYEAIRSDRLWLMKKKLTPKVRKECEQLLK